MQKRQAAERRIRVLAEHVTAKEEVGRAERAAVVPSTTAGNSSRQYASVTGEPSTYEKVIVDWHRDVCFVSLLVRQLPGKARQSTGEPREEQRALASRICRSACM